MNRILGFSFLFSLFIVMVFFLIQRFRKRLEQKRQIITQIQVLQGIQELPIFLPTSKNKLRAYNPCILFIQGKLFQIFRLSNFNFCPQSPNLNFYKLKNEIVIVSPDRNEIQVRYPIQKKCRLRSPNYEDPRAFLFWKELVLLVSNPQTKNCHCQMELLFLPLEPLHVSRPFSIYPNRILPLSYHDSHLERNEKNWMPFVYQNDIYFIYSVNPHTILQCCTKTGACIKKFETLNQSIPYGIRGGTAPRLLNEDYWLTFGHFYKNPFHNRKYSMIYSSIGYIFENKPPFRIVAMTDEFFLSETKKPNMFGHVIEFLTGLEIRDHMVYLSYGVNDCYSKLVSIPIPQLLTYFKPCPI